MTGFRRRLGQVALRMRQRRAKGSHSSNFRPDIEGLRAVAVVVVILEHLFGWPIGGFVGVDIFFVISGFLITGLLLKEHDRTGRVSFLDFYRRRIRRIIPASTLVLVITVVASYFVFRESRAHAVEVDSLWSILFVANWHFASIGTDYFTQAGPVSPLQHYWSLAVEEQFYVVWPVLIAVILGVGSALKHGSTGNRKRVLGVTLTLLMAGSFVWALRQTSIDATAAYFSTLTRAWELGVGALIAVSSGIFSRLPSVVRPFLSWLGIAGIAASIVILSTDAAFPAPGAVLPVLSAGCVIVAGIGGSVRYVWPLTNIASRYFGRISYSLYLWHFPVIIVGAALVPGRRADYFFAVLTVTLIVSILAFHLVEDPIRESAWLQPSSTRSASPVRESAVAGRLLTAFAIITGCAVVLTTLYYGQPLTQAQTAQIIASASAKTTPDAKEPATGSQSSLDESLSRQIDAALTATAWPALTPSLDLVISTDTTARDITACSGARPPEQAKCTFGHPNAPKTVVVMGDSVSVAYLTAFRDMVSTPESKWKLIALSMFGCTFVDIPIHNADAILQGACPARKAAAVAGVAMLKPDLVVVTNTYEPRKNAETGASVTDEQWSAGMSSFVAKLVPHAKAVMLLAPPPSDVDIAQCYTKASSPADCIGSITEQWSRLADVEKTLATKVQAAFVDSRAWFCSAQGQCPSFVGSVPVKRDLVHITSQYAVKITPVMLADLRSKGYFQN